MTGSSLAETTRGLRAVDVVERPPTWRAQPLTVSYLYPDHEPDAAGAAALYRWSIDAGYPNARVLSPRTVQWSEVFHPRFYEALRGTPELVPPVHVRLRDAPGLDGPARLTELWLESTVFLASVTLSAAIVQSRWSAGTLASKYDRLWQVGQLAQAGVVPAVQELDLPSAVRTLASDATMPAVDRLLAIRSLFEQVMARIPSTRPYERSVLRPAPLPPELTARFAFVPDLRERLGPDLVAVVAYGSAVTSPNFADIDLLLVSTRPDRTLRTLAGTSPRAGGKELNVGVYSPEELWRMQLLSGDNLVDYGVCLYGDVEVPTKERGLLLARNLSFGVVRQRQQLGMVGAAMAQESAAPTDGDDRRSLYEYFVKIPANVVKGTWGSEGRQVPKDVVYAWLRSTCGFDTVAQQAAVMSGTPGVALAAAAVATGTAMAALDTDLAILTTGPGPTDPGPGPTDPVPTDPAQGEPR